MMRRSVSRFLIVAWLSVPQLLLAQQESEFAGAWMVTLDVPPADIIGRLEIEAADHGWSAWVEGGPAGLSIDGRSIEVVVDSRDIAGFVFERKLVGTLSGDSIQGTLTIIDNDDSPENGASWTAVRAPEMSNGTMAARPVDLAGVWVPATGVDFRKYSMDLTPAAEAWHADYLFHLDQPNVRCVSPGLVALNAWGGYPQEWLQREDRITALFEVGSEVRRVYLDGREFPGWFPPSPMGYSIGHWDGSALVIETRFLTPNVRDFRGEPISENARVIERYELSADGNRMSGLMTLHDPENYERPPLRRRAWNRNPETEILPYECDPDSFFRQLWEENRMQEYMDRADRRF